MAFYSLRKNFKRTRLFTGLFSRLHSFLPSSLLLLVKKPLFLTSTGNLDLGFSWIILTHGSISYLDIYFSKSLFLKKILRAPESDLWRSEFHGTDGWGQREGHFTNSSAETTVGQGHRQVDSFKLSPQIRVGPLPYFIPIVQRIIHTHTHTSSQKININF